jgi:ketosteroid isomerase-like protein
MGDGLLDSIGLETLVFVKDADGNWKIRHSHTSSRASFPGRMSLGLAGPS